jgi:hypothetical protein
VRHVGQVPRLEPALLHVARWSTPTMRPTVRLPARGLGGRVSSETEGRELR